jgi:hypothetical protein
MPAQTSKLDLHDFQDAPVRSASMQLWPEEVDIRLLTAPIISAITLLKLWPARIEVRHAHSKRLQVRKWKSEREATLDEFGEIEHLSAMTSLPHTQTNTDAVLRTLSIGNDLLYFESSPELLTVELAIEILSGFIPFMTPRFGFGEVTKRVWSFQYHWGIQGSGMDKNRTARAQKLDQLRFTMPGEEPILGRHLFDIHELNFLTQHHLDLAVFGTTLEKWISAGSHGTLKKMKPGVFVWLIPDTMRNNIRSQFLNAGYLLAPV